MIETTYDYSPKKIVLKDNTHKIVQGENGCNKTMIKKEESMQIYKLESKAQCKNDDLNRKSL